MKYLLLEGFPKGLDARKFNLSAPPGTLTELNNGHLTNGGEIEKRKAFVLYANVAITETGATATAGVRTFGIQKTAAGLTVFGSALQFGASVTLSQPVLASAMPAGITYQQLKHPAVTDGETYVAANHAMTAVRSSTSYGGLIYALATFADGNTFGYYDGTLVRDFTDGLIMAHLNTNTKIATAIKEMVNRTGRYTATNPSGTVAEVTGPLGLAYDSLVDDDSAGTLAVAKVSDPTPPSAARQAIGSFAVIAGSQSAGTNKITKVEVNGVTITNAAVDWTTSNEVTAGLLAASINLKASTPEYTAEATGNGVTIKALSTDGDSPNNFEVKVTAAGNVCIGKAQFQVMASSGFTNADCFAGGVSITGGVIAYTTSPAATAAAIATAINAGTSSGATHGYLANATGSIISISKAVTSSNDADIPIFFVVTGGGAGNSIFEVGSGTAAQTGLAALLLVTGSYTTVARSGQQNENFNLSLNITGGIAPYQSPIWHGYAVYAVSSNQFVTGAVPWPDASRKPLVPHIYCVVTDSALATAQSNTL